MRGRRSNSPETESDRGLSTPLSHVLSVAITTLLVMGLVTSATGLLESQNDRTAREELDTVGNRLAAELDHVDSLASNSDNVSITTDQIDRVAGSTYDAVLEHGSCSEVRTDTCLRLSSTRFDHSPVLPIDNETDLSLQQHGEGRFTIRSDGGTTVSESQLVSFDPSSRIGIGRSVGRGPSLGVGGAVGERPIPKISFDPGSPKISEMITFDASGSFDPDGSIETYRWDFTDDGSWDAETDSTPEWDWDYSTTGTKNVTLQVEDDSGTTASTTETFTVGGLVYNEDLEFYPGDYEVISYTVTNHYAETVELERILIGPRDGSSHRLETDSGYEIEVDAGDNGFEDGYVGWDPYEFWPPSRRTPSGLDLDEAGSIVSLVTDGDNNRGPVALTTGETARVTLKFDQPIDSSDEFELGVRYRLEELRRGIIFTDTPDSP